MVESDRNRAITAEQPRGWGPGEPRLVDILAEPIVRMVMLSDGVSTVELVRLMVRGQSGRMAEFPSNTAA